MGAVDRQIKEAAARIFDELSLSLQGGHMNPRIRVGLTLAGSEHGEEELRRGARLAQADDLEVVLLEEADLLQAHQRMEAMLDNGALDAAVTMHYNFPVGVATIGRAVTPGFGRSMYIASTTGTSDTQRGSAMVKNAVSAIAVAKACGCPIPTLGILNLDGSRQAERALRALKQAGYPIAFTQSDRAGGGVIMRGNDLLRGVPDIMLMDSLTGNVMMKTLSAYTTGGDYESVGDGYGPGVGMGYGRIISIVSRASGAPVVAGALRYTCRCAKGGLAAKVRDEFSKARAAGLDQILEDLARPADEGRAAQASKPDEKAVDEEITGVEILELDEAVRAVWKKGIYAAGGMGCTGPVVMVAKEDAEAAHAALREAGYL
ncbi:MAG: glycine/sarcosine/betaine reductase complex component C subunit alpha [Clostridia bacterium]|nr:glycine/sarcosine/betaine reductase complex component C subunit alpha [Clostridia bacterium]